MYLNLIIQLLIVAIALRIGATATATCG